MRGKNKHHQRTIHLLLGRRLVCLQLHLGQLYPVKRKYLLLSLFGDYEWLKDDFPGGPVVKHLLAVQGGTCLILVQDDPTCLGATKPKYHNY